MSESLTEWAPYIFCYILHYIHAANMLKSDKLQAIPFLQCTSTHNSIYRDVRSIHTAMFYNMQATCDPISVDPCLY